MFIKFSTFQQIIEPAHAIPAISIRLQTDPVQLHVHAALTLLLLLGILLFPPRNDPDQAGRGTTLLVTGLLLGNLKMRSADMM